MISTDSDTGKLKDWWISYLMSEFKYRIPFDARFPLNQKMEKQTAEKCFVPYLSSIVVSLSM
jgi:hypothetical protein